MPKTQGGSGGHGAAQGRSAVVCAGPPHQVGLRLSSGGNRLLHAATTDSLRATALSVDAGVFEHACHALGTAGTPTTDARRIEVVCNTLGTPQIAVDATLVSAV